MLDQPTAIALNRFGLGARPGEWRLVRDAPRDWLREQLDAAGPATTARRGIPSAETLRQVDELRRARQAARARAARDEPANASSPARQAGREFRRFIADQYVEQIGDRYARAISTDAPFVERLVHFWSNHFAVSADKLPIGALAGLYEGEAIRPHVTGRFVDMLRAVEQHPAMLLYLDNQASIGPESLAARTVRLRRGRTLGLNENLAREILELHTLGVDGGYDQHDVTEFAKVLTGWSVGGQQTAGRRRMQPGERAGEFFFRPLAHEPGDKNILGTRYRENDLHEGELVLEDLAAHPATAHYLATKLARHFVADQPPPALVEQLAGTYLRSGGDLSSVYRDLIAAEESWATPLAKFKSPHDFVISTFRALGGQPERGARIIPVLTQLGQRPLTPGSPAGWPDTAANWSGGDALLKRIEFAAALGRATGDRVDATELAVSILGDVASEHTMSSVARAESGAQAIAILFAAPEFQRR